MRLLTRVYGSMVCVPANILYSMAYPLSESVHIHFHLHDIEVWGCQYFS